jgi:hypothetical protein
MKPCCCSGCGCCACAKPLPVTPQSVTWLVAAILLCAAWVQLYKLLIGLCDVQHALQVRELPTAYAAPVLT